MTKLQVLPEQTIANSLFQGKAHKISLNRALLTGRITSQIALLFTILFFAPFAHAAKDPIYTSFLNSKAVGGYDAVSYFQGDGIPVEGNKDYAMNYMGAQWLFSSQENLEAFKQDPEKYAPQYGGYCAYAVGIGQTAKGDPLQYHISDDKLYLNINKKYRQVWLNDIDNYITNGDKNWPNVLK